MKTKQNATGLTCGFGLSADIGSFVLHSFEFVRIKYFRNGLPTSLGIQQNPITYDTAQKNSGKTHEDLVKNKEDMFSQTLGMSMEMVQRDLMGMDCDGGFTTTKESVQARMKKEYSLNDLFVEGDDAAHQMERVMTQVT